MTIGVRGSMLELEEEEGEGEEEEEEEDNILHMHDLHEVCISERKDEEIKVIKGELVLCSLVIIRYLIMVGLSFSQR